MKKLFTLFAVLLLSFGARAQWIDSLVVVPAMPDANDTIRIYAHLSFPQGSCVDVGYVSVVGNDIYGNGFHCMGNIMSICYDVDTLVIPPLMAGNYMLYFTLDAGFGPPGNCSPGFQPYDVDTLLIPVTTILDVPAIEDPTLSIFPVPASDFVVINLPGATIAQVQFTNVIGEIVYTSAANQGTLEVATREWASGIYFCRVTDSNGRTFVQKMEVAR